jgi:hypothetical protein
MGGGRGPGRGGSRPGSCGGLSRGGPAGGGGLLGGVEGVVGDILRPTVSERGSGFGYGEERVERLYYGERVAFRFEERLKVGRSAIRPVGNRLRIFSYPWNQRGRSA